MEFIKYLPIKQKYKDVLSNNLDSDISSYKDLGIIVIKKFVIWKNENLFEDFLSSLNSYTISFVGYMVYSLDDKFLPGVGYGNSYIILNEFYSHFLKELENKIEKNPKVFIEKEPEMCSKNDLYTVKVPDIGEIKTQCIKVDSLRKKYGDKDITLKKWMEMPNNIYVGRRGRIFIDREIFHYKESKWHNPYTLKEYSLEESLKLYKKHIKDSGLFKDLDELKGKTLGCFCDQSGDCHAKVLARMYLKKKEKETEKLDKKIQKETKLREELIEKPKITIEPIKIETLSYLVKKKRKEVIKYYENFEGDDWETFNTFLMYINSLMYLDEVQNSGRYTIEDVKDIKVKQLFKGDIVINIETFLPFFYKKGVLEEKSEEFINNLLLKYQGWYVVLLQRLYKKRVDESFEVQNERDSSFDYIVIIGTGN